MASAQAGETLAVINRRRGRNCFRGGATARSRQPVENEKRIPSWTVNLRIDLKRIIWEEGTPRIAKYPYRRK